MYEFGKQREKSSISSFRNKNHSYSVARVKVKGSFRGLTSHVWWIIDNDCAECWAENVKCIVLRPW